MFFSFTLIPCLSTAFTLTSPKQIRFARSFKLNVLHICMHRAHHPDSHPISKRHALHRSEIWFSLNTIRRNQLAIAFASLSSKVLHPVHPLINSFLTSTTSQSHLSILFCFTSKSLHPVWDHTSASYPNISLPSFTVYNPRPLLQLKSEGKLIIMSIIRTPSSRPRATVSVLFVYGRRQI